MSAASSSETLIPYVSSSSITSSYRSRESASRSSRIRVDSEICWSGISSSVDRCSRTFCTRSARLKPSAVTQSPPTTPACRGADVYAPELPCCGSAAAPRSDYLPITHAPARHAGALQELRGPLDRALLDRAGREPDGVGDPVGARASMSHHRKTPQPEQDRAAGRIRVHLAPQRAERRSQEHAAKPSAWAGARRLTHGVGHRPRGPLDGLQHDVPGEAVGDDDVGGALHHVPSLDVPEELDPARFRKPRIGLDDLR